jgi:hypothetical protein
MIQLTATDARLSDHADVILLAIGAQDDPDDNEVYPLSGSDALHLYMSLARAMDALARRQDADRTLANDLKEVQPR